MSTWELEYVECRMIFFHFLQACSRDDPAEAHQIIIDTVSDVFSGIFPHEETGDGSFKCVVIGANPRIDCADFSIKPFLHYDGQLSLTLCSSTALGNDSAEKYLFFGQMMAAVESKLKHGVDDAGFVAVETLLELHSPPDSFAGISMEWRDGVDIRISNLRCRL